jgi:Barstar (barnase inhibitor)
MASIVEHPFVFIATSEASRLPEGLRRVRLSGDNLRTTAALMDAFATEFRFPDYFGRNWNALYDGLVDLDWFPPDGYVVVITEADAVLADEPLHPEFDEPSELAVLLDILCRAAEEWNAAVAEGQPWDRPGVPFYVVLEVTSDRIETVQHRVAAARREIPLLESL